ncbi:MAG: lantibiotic dehydratase [Polyangiaceae bacterium]|nr:lantibiotic dehydratase [Polyangiaceae bacterium]
MLRTPLLPFEALLTPKTEAARALAEGGDLDAAVAADRRAFWARALRLLDEPDVREALELASPSFAQALEAWRSAPTAARGANVEATLARYLQRMTSRATPFGLFAGQTPGVLADRTELRLAPRPRYRRHTRLRREALVALAAAAPPATVLRANPTLYRASHEARELRYVVASDRDGAPGLVAAVEAGEEVQAVLTYAAEARERAAIVAFTQSQGAAPAEAEGLTEALIAAGLLVDDREPPLTGDDPLRALAEELAVRPGASALAGRTAAVVEALAMANAGATLAWAPPLREAVAASLAALTGVDACPARALSVALDKPAEVATLSERAAARLEATARALAAMGFARAGDPLGAFKRAYRDRFEGEELPLLAALDDETGVGASLDEGAGLVAVAAPPAHLVRLFADALARGARSIDLRADDVAALCSPRARPLPAAYAALAQVAPDPEGSEPALYLQGAQGPSGCRLLGRFTHDAGLRALVDAHLRAEEALEPDAIFAEIVHAPGEGGADALVRPALRAFEIPCFARSSAPADRRLELAELRVSVRDDRVILRSPRLGKRVIARGTHAHHFASSPVPAYRFLGLLQEQGVSAEVAWGWGALEAAPFLPRVAIDGVVVSLARWRLSGEERRALATSSGAALVRAASAIRQARGLPRYVSLPDGDRVALLDFDSVVSLEAASRLFARETEGLLQELFAPPERSCVRGDGGGFAHELVVPFVAVSSSELPAPSVAAASATGGPPASAFAGHRPAGRDPGLLSALGRRALAGGRRAYPPGTEWLYVRLEAAASVHDRLLATVVAPIVQQAQASGAIDAWFFVRLAAPTPHLRVRFHGEAGRLRSEVLAALERACAPHVRERRLLRFSIETYEREIERYGGEAGMALAEGLFYLDSEAALALVEGGLLETPADRWRAALLGVGHLLGDLGLDRAARRRLVTRLAGACRAELGLDDGAQRRLDARFRAERAGLESLRAGRGASGLHAAFAARSRGVKALAGELAEAARAGALRVPLEELAATFAHVHVGRLVSGAVRPTELLVYDFLRRLDRAEAARRREEG